jgi:1,4-alpha-glucan branching enzyme
METVTRKTGGSGQLAKATVKPVNFYCSAPKAHSVFLAGDFNDWNPSSHAMERRVDGWWFLQVLLAHGHYRYRFIVDGKLRLDPQAVGVARDERGEQVSLMSVS